MWNPSLVSGDVGVGINVRRLRRDFLRYLFSFQVFFFILMGQCFFSGICSIICC